MTIDTVLEPPALQTAAAGGDINPKPEIVYPESDGKPMADNTRQFRYIVTIQGGLDALFRDDPDVFVAGDLLWYPVEGNNQVRVAPDVMVLDSIQTLYSENIPASQGSIAQIRGVTAEIITFAKTRNIMVFILGHVTKDGDIAGPKLLEHMVDTVLYFESETVQNYRILRVNKNRFGPTSEIGVFEMTGTGLREVPNPSAVFVEYHKNLVGTVTTCVMEGSRPLLTQVQALESAERSARTQLESTRLGYQVGVRIQLDVLNATTQLVSTQRDLKQARYNFLLSGLGLKDRYAACGRNPASPSSPGGDLCIP